MKKMFILAFSIVFLSIVSSFAQQAPAPRPPQTGTISGSVVKADTGQPIARVQVNLTRVGIAAAPAADPTSPGARGAEPDGSQVIVGQQLPLMVVPTVLTDDSGKFTLKDVPAGSYRVNAVRNGFSRQEFGQHSLGRPGTTLNVRAGQAIADINFRLIPAATITGRVFDTNGDPLPGVSVQALRTTYDATGNRSLQPMGVAKTNDLGEYRLYWINPGRYFVNANAAATGLEALAAMSSQAASIQTPSSAEEAQAMAQAQSILGPGKNPNEATNSGLMVSYFPGTPDVARAVAVELQPGSEIHGIDFTLTRDQKVRIRGKVLEAATGRPPKSAQVSVIPRSGSGGSPMDAIMSLSGGALQGNSYNSDTGEFEAREVASGKYYLQVVVVPERPPAAAGARGAAPAPDPTNPADALEMFASITTTQIPVDVFGSDIENVTIMVSPGITIPGRIHLDGPQQIAGNQNPYDRFNVSLTKGAGPDILALLGGGGNGKPTTEGTFSLSRITPGDYKVSVSGMSPNMYIKEARLDQMDILVGVTIGDRVSGTLEVTISSNAGQLDGTITDAVSKPVTGVQAVLIPDKNRERRDLYKIALSDMDGHFTIRGLVPGNYKLFAWEDIEPFSYFDPDVLKDFEQKGKAITIRESLKETVEMKLIPAATP